jgi:hypothetical protein
MIAGLPLLKKLINFAIETSRIGAAETADSHGRRRIVTDNPR